MDHYYQKVEGWFNFPDMYAFAVQQAPQKGKFVEVGPWKGQSSSFLAVEIINSGKDITLDCVDNFSGSPIEPGQMYDPDNQAGRLFEVFTNNMKPVEEARPGMVKGIKGDSAESASLYEDESLDFVFIDASHDYESFRKDLLAWHPKVKVGGLFAGHDFADPYPGIMKAIKDHCSHEQVRITPSTCWFFTKTTKNLTNI